MKTFLFIIACGSLTLLSISIEAQNIEGQPIASQYGAFQLQGTATNSFVFAPAACQVTAGGVNFSALTQGVPVRVVDPGNHSLDETINAGLVNINACSVQLAVSNTHVPPFYVTSGTAGLQEAINANSKGGPANTVVLDGSWYALGGSSGIITSVHGSTSLGLVDITTTPYTWYSWNGSAYAQVAIGGGCSGGCVTALNGISGGMALTPGSNITVAPSGQNIEISAATGVPSVNGVTAATTIAPGANITVSTSGNTITVAAAGGAGTGAVGSGNQYQDATYPNSGSTTTVGAATNKYTVPTELSTSQLNTLFSSLTTGTATIQNGDGITPFANPNFVGVQDLRETFPVSDWNVKESGAQCDLQGGFGSLTAGSTTVTATSGRFFSPDDVGKNLEMVGFDTVTNLPSRFDPMITVFTDSTHVTISTPAPFTVSDFSMKVGHRDDAAIASAFGHFSFIRPILFPVGDCWSDTIAVYGQSFHGLSSTESQVTGLAGDDVFSGLDPSKVGFQSMSPGMQIHDMAWNFDARINASRPWEDVNASGAVTAHAASYRPVGLFTAWANYPLGPGWIQGTGPNNNGATNGVAVTTQNSAVICIPTSEKQPPVGQTIIFPYFASVFTSTVSSLTGAGCATGSNPLTMTAALPNTSGYTTTQSEWMAGTSVQTITQSNAGGSFANGIPATGRTFPFILRLANNINPPLTVNAAATGSNVAPYGLVQIDGEQFSYFSDSSYPASTSTTYWIQITAGAQNGTSAAAHSLGATIVPLNPFQPTWPWPVTPSLNAGVMPANASYFPAWDIGNAGFAQPWYNGASGAAGYGLSYTNIHDITIQQDPNYSGSGNPAENAASFQLQNATTGIYITAIPFKATFKNIRVIDPQFGIFEAEPSINTYGVFAAFPTANGSTWQNITIQSAAFDTFFIGGQNDTKRDFLTFCQNFGEIGNSWPGLTPGQFGCGAAWIWGGIYDDKDGGGGSDNTTATLDNWYIEAENGTQAELQPYYEFNCGLCTYINMQPSGAVAFLEGANNNFTGTRFNADGQFPIINYGANTIMRFIQGVSNSGNSNVYGTGSFLGYGPNASIMGQENAQSGPFGSLASGNAIATVSGQTGDVFATGNDTAAYISNSSAILYPDQIAAASWTFDDTAPISHSYMGCTVGDGVGCTISEFDGDGRIPIGKDQLIALGQYVVHYAFKTPQGGTTFNFTLKAVDTGLGTCSDPSVIFNINVTTTGMGWQQFQSGPGDFSASQGCDLQMILQGAPSTVPVLMAYMAFSPVWHNVTLPTNTPADNATCTPGAFLGSDSNFLYICTASGTVKRAALSTY